MRYPRQLAFVVFSGVLFGLAWHAGLSHAEPRDAAVDRSAVTVELDYGAATVSGSGSTQWTTGATLATFPADERGLSTFVLSLAFDRGGLDAGSLHVNALDADGNVLPIAETSKASGAGSENRVVTFVCSFKQRHQEIKKLVVERRQR